MTSPNLLEITGDHIGKLTDADLRGLVTRLCEAELRRCGLPSSATTAGGHQDAADGGIDVRVRLDATSPCLDFIPRANTGFQAKASPMPASEISAEMRPKGTLRRSISELGKVHGAYVIVSSRDSAADIALDARLKAMNDALSDLESGSTVKVDFYDRERLASWVRKYPGVALWVRERIGEPMSGWRPYGNWAPGDSPGSEFLLDKSGRIYAGNREEPLKVIDGIKAIRGTLAAPGGVVRLVGLSGVGKTRLVQALFDSRVGADVLDTNIVAYTDQGAEPDPSARDMVHRLRVAGLRSIVVVDNCNPATHRALAQATKEPGGTVSLITVEHDVADDEPEDTDVFHLEPASNEVVEQILDRLVPNVSRPDRTRIADISGGNARVAIALAKTIRGRESLGVLNDAELFKRLFYQNQRPDPVLLRVAEVCSLIYSFDVETDEGADAELPKLASLAGVTVKDLYRCVSDLYGRDLVQKRGKWRAVLPHAIANRLAKQAFDHIPSNTIVEVFRGHQRLLKSFGRRLGYLHDCPVAVEIARKWLQDDTWLGDARRLNDLGVALFLNVAPLCPSLVLDVMEKAATGQDATQVLASDVIRRERWIWLLRALAYETSMFDRAAHLLARVVVASGGRGDRDNSRSNFEELFHIVLSGTQAAAEQRANFLRRLLAEEDPRFRELALTGLDGMLRTGQFTSGHDFSFGARSRDFGWHPRTGADVENWYRMVLLLVQDLCEKKSLFRARARTLLARHFRGLWMHGGVQSELIDIAQHLAHDGGWSEGWIAVRKTLKYGEKNLLPASVEQLRKLEAELRPQDLEQKLDAYVLSETYGHLDVADVEAKDDSGEALTAAWELADKIAESLGRQFAVAPDLLVQALPKLLRCGQGRLWSFGRGLAMGVDDVKSKWQEIREVFAGLNETERNVSLMQGYIRQAMERDRDLAGALLDAAIEDPVLAPSFPLLQAAMLVGDIGAERLSRSVAKGVAKAWTYRQLGLGRASDGITPAAFKKLILEISQLPDGFPTAVDLLGMRLHILKSDKAIVDEETLALGRELLARCTFDNQDDNLDYHVAETARVCLVGQLAARDARRLAENFVQALQGHGPAWRYDQLARVLFEVQPEVALDVFFDRTDNRGRSALSRLSMIHDGDSPVNRVPNEMLLSWATKDVSTRFPWLAGEVRLLSKGPDQNELKWSELALHLLEHATERKEVLGAFDSHLEPHSWSGSLADVLTPYLKPIRGLLKHSDPKVREWAVDRERRLLARIEEERKQERRTDASFE